VGGLNLQSWTGLPYPAKDLLCAYRDGVTRTGNPHIVAFGAEGGDEEEGSLHPEEDIEKTKAAILHFHDMDIKRIVRTTTSLSSSCVLQLT
jgi:hypothetical protein